MRSVVHGLLVGAAAVALVGTAACKSDSSHGSRAKVPAKKVHGRFADAVKVSDHGWMLSNSPPPPSRAETLAHPLKYSMDGDAGPGGALQGGGGAGPGNGGGGSGHKRFGQSPVYVNGVAVAVAAYGELPPWLPTRPFKLGDGRLATRFRIAEYLAALGVNVGKIKEVHFYGGRGRIGIVKGDEIRRMRDKLEFSFTQDTQGKMRMHWDNGVKVSDSIDKVQAVAVYVHKKPPTWNMGKWGLVDDDGNRIEGIPYAEEPLKGGVRIYLDGHIANVLKRKNTFTRKVAPDRVVDGVPYFGLFSYLHDVKVNGSKVVAIELLSRNEIVERLDGPALAAERGRLEIAAPPRSSGRIQVSFGPESDRKTVLVTAIEMYTPRRARAHFRR